MRATAVPSEAARMIIITYDDGQPADPKVVRWVADQLNKLFGGIDPSPQAPGIE